MTLESMNLWFINYHFKHIYSVSIDNVTLFPTKWWWIFSSIENDCAIEILESSRKENVWIIHFATITYLVWQLKNR
jgi:hypothetical protein